MGKIYWLNYRSSDWGRPGLINGFVKYFVSPSEIFTYSEIDLKRKYPKFSNDNKFLLEQTRGSGYWLWKPFLIRATLEELDWDDYLIYADAGKSIKYLPFTNCRSIIKWMDENNFSVFPGIKIPEHGVNENWCKREVYERLIPDSERQKFLETSQYQATNLVFKKTLDSIAFTDTWLELCTVTRFIDDSYDPAIQSDRFIEHRHDQALLSILAFNTGLPSINNDNQIIKFGKSISVIDLFCRTRFGNRLDLVKFFFLMALFDSAHYLYRYALKIKRSIGR